MKTVKTYFLVILCFVCTIGYTQTISKPLLKIEVQEGKIVNVTELDETVSPDSEVQADMLEPQSNYVQDINSELLLKRDPSADKTLPTGNDADEINSIPDKQEEIIEPEPAEVMEVGKLSFDPLAPVVEKEPFNPRLHQVYTSEDESNPRIRKGSTTFSINLDDLKSPDKSTGSVNFGTGNVNWVINDDGWLCWHPTSTDAIPAGAYVTNVTYRLRIIPDDSNPFWCVDYEIWLSNTNHGWCTKYLNVYDNLGDITDGGYDDDVDDDADIYLNNRTTSAFNGESPGQQWMIYIEDNITDGYGLIQYAELTIDWEAPDDCDLVATSLTLTDTDWQTGESITGGLTEYNYGPSTAGAHYSRLYLSTNTTITTADVLLGSDIYFSSIAASSSQTQYSTFTVPSVSNGTFYVGIMVDYYNDVAESDEDNITYRSGSITVNNTDSPDLVATYLTLTDTDWDIGESITAGLTEENWDAGAAGYHWSRLYLSTNTTISTADVLLGSDIYFSSIAGGGSQTQNSTFSVPYVSEGTYYVGIMVDFYDDVPESDESNNITYRTGTVYVNGTTIDIDLAPTFMYLSTDDWNIGSSVTADLVVINNGSDAAGAHDSRLYLSTNTTISTTDTQLGGDLYFSGIAAGVSETVGSTFTVPSVSEGTYYLGVMVDFYNVVPETDESNNIATRNGTVYIHGSPGDPDIDIQPGSITINESTKQLEISEMALTAVPDPNSLIDEKYIVSREVDPNNPDMEIVGIIVPGQPPKDYRAPEAVPNKSAVTISNVPAFTWVFGCSATSAAMIAGYYDNTGFPDMYTGPTNGGVMPMDNSIWGTEVINGETRAHCPLSATSEGIDGRSTRGHVEDYWVQVDHAGPDPFITNGWTEHTWEDCTGDFMGTNQSNWNNSDASTMFYYYTNGAPLYDYTGGESSGNKDGCHGFKEFIESRGYTVVSNYNQYIYGYNGNTQGFTYDQYKAEIDAGRPVMIQVQGHSMVGFGYDDASTTIYIHDTWDYSSHTMTWGGSYSYMQHYAVGVFEIEGGGEPPVPDCFTIQNVGSANLTVSAVSDDKDWLDITGLPGIPFTISSGADQGMCVTVDWGLVSGTSDMATITVTSDDPDEPTFDVYVTVNRSAIPPEAPSLTSPANGATCQPTAITFNWTDPGDVDSYSLQIDDNSDFSSPFIDDSGIGSTSQNVSGLNDNTAYYWRVNATNVSGTSDWSSSWVFTVAPEPISGAPTLDSPADEATWVPVSPTMIWNIMSGASSYQLQIDDNIDFGSCVFDQSGITTNTADVSGLDHASAHYWRVKAFDDCGGESDWSYVWSFMSAPNDLPIISGNEYMLGQNYPNPFNQSTTTIDFVIPVNTEVTFEILDINGKTISIQKNFYEAGMNSITFDFMDELSNGVYYYRMKTADFIQTKIMLVE